MVSLAFPDKELAQQSGLAKGIHQLRYLISSQQAQYIRSHFRSEGMTDAQALAIFLKDKKAQLFGAASLTTRLWNRLVCITS